MTFKGHDFGELAEAWGLPLVEDDDDDFCNISDAAIICDFINDNYNHDDDTLNETIRQDMIDFLVALKEDEHSSKGLKLFCNFLLLLSTLEDDREFVNYYMQNIEMLWN